jgi:transcriptional regulator GlxA family with amidase domain
LPRGNERAKYGVTTIGSAQPSAAGVAMNEGPREIGFLLIPNFSILPFMLALESLRVANREGGRRLYRWHLISSDGEPVPASNGMTFTPDGALDQWLRLPSVIVCAGVDPQCFDDRRTFAALRRLARHGTTLGALCTGSYVLARAGLLDGYRCTIHWENLAGFAEDFPDIEVSSELIEFDRDRFTCSGGITALDMMLHMIARDHGQELAMAVSEQFIHDRIRDPHDHQRMALRMRLGIRHPKLLAAVALMEDNLESPLALSELSACVGVTKRQIERLFRTHLGCTPMRHYTKLRLARAKRLIDQTSMPITAIGVACGFGSSSYFSKCYRAFFGFSPSRTRRAA